MSAQSIAHKAYVKFFASSIPLGGRVTVASLAAGAALASLAVAHGVETQLFRRDEVYWGAVACQRMRAINASIVAELDALPDSPQRRKAIEKLHAYSKALSCC